MAALSAERVVSRRGATGAAAGRLRYLGVKTGIKIWKGSLVATDATGYAIAGAGIAATGLKVWGVAQATVDNTSGASGAVTVPVIQGAEWPFANLGGDPLAQADIGNTCYVDDDQTVRKTSNTSTRSNAGTFVGFDEQGLPVVLVGNFSQTGV